MKISGTMSEMLPQDGDLIGKAIVRTVATANSDIPDMGIADLVRSVNGETRLLHCLNRGNFPFRTVAEYMRHENPVKALGTVINMGPKTVQTLDQIIRGFITDPQKYISLNQNEEVTQDTVPEVSPARLFAGIAFPDVLSSFPLSSRLKRLLLAVKEERRYLTLADVLEDYKKFMVIMRSLPNVGKTTLVELESNITEVLKYVARQAKLTNAEGLHLIGRLLGGRKHPEDSPAILEQITVKLEEAGAIPDFASISFTVAPEIPEDADVSDNAALSALVKKLLDARSCDVVARRFGLGRDRPETLKEVGEAYKLTKERIRQIERNAIRRLSVLQPLFSQVLENEDAEIQVSVFGDSTYFYTSEQHRRYMAMAGRHQLAVDIVHGDFKAYLMQTCDLYKGNWIRRSADTAAITGLKRTIQGGQDRRRIEKVITGALYRQEWPASFDRLCGALPGYTRAAISKALTRKVGAIIKADGTLSFNSDARPALRIALVLKAAGYPLSLSELRDYQNQMFGVDSNEHAISSIIARSKECMIAGYGKYCLSEHLPLSADTLNAIRKKCWHYLRKKKVFIRCHEMFDDLFSDDHDFSPDFNPHMLFGILRNDETFVRKRGLIVGIRPVS